jgi:hypothetical protein
MKSLTDHGNNNHFQIGIHAAKRVGVKIIGSTAFSVGKK